MSSHLPSAEPQRRPEFCSLLKNNWGQRGGSDANHYRLLALLVLQGAAEQFGAGMMPGGEDHFPKAGSHLMSLQGPKNGNQSSWMSIFTPLHPQMLP